MAISPLIPLAATLAAPLATQVVRQVATGLPFGRWLAAPQTRAANPAAAEKGAGSPELNGLARQLRWETRQQEPAVDVASFQAQLERQFRAAGIDTTQTIELQLAADGHIWERSGHPQRTQIEQLLTDPELIAAFHQLVDRLGQLKTPARPPDATDVRIQLRQGRIEVV